MVFKIEDASPLSIAMQATNFELQLHALHILSATLSWIGFSSHPSLAISPKPEISPLLLITHFSHAFGDRGPVALRSSFEQSFSNLYPKGIAVVGLDFRARLSSAKACLPLHNSGVVRFLIWSFCRFSRLCNHH